MIKILPLPAAAPVYQGGQYTYCANLSNLFKGNNMIEFDHISQPKCTLLPFFRKYWYDWDALDRRVRDSGCDIVFINGYAEFSVWQEFITAKRLGKKIVYAPHFHPFEYLERPTMGKIFFNLCIRPLLKWASAIVTIGNTDYGYFRSISDPNNVYMIPHHFIRPVRENVAPAKKENMILFVGRNEPNKGMEYLYSLPEKYEVHCVTGGELKRKDFIQHRNISQVELNNLYEQASLVVIPSRYEAFSYVALEAITHGTPVVMSSNVKIADHLSGEKGYTIFPFGDVRAFLKAVERTIGCEVNKEQILAKFNPETIRCRYEEMFACVMNEE